MKNRLGILAFTFTSFSTFFKKVLKLVNTKARMWLYLRQQNLGVQGVCQQDAASSSETDHAYTPRVTYVYSQLNMSQTLNGLSLN